MNLNTPFLTTLAPSMKRSVIIAAVATAAMVALFFLAVLPSRAKLKAVQKEIVELNATISKMRAEIAGTDQQKAKTETAAANVEALVSAGVIDPLLGSFAMRGKSLLDPIAQETGFTIDSVRESDPIKLQVPTPAPEQLFARQPVEFSGHGSYEQIVAFIARVEKNMPMAALSSLRILSQPQTPETHKAFITFEWPIKGEKRQPPAKPAK